MLAEGVDLVCRAFDRRQPFASRWPVLVLVEVASSVGRSGGSVEQLAAAVAGLGAVRDSAVADDTAGRAELWSYREDHTLAINTLGPPHKLDVTLPQVDLARFLADVPERVRAVAPDAAVWLFGHVADGNIHVNVTGLRDEDVGVQVDDAVLGLVAERGGSISAEHGIGTAKRAWLHLNRSKAEIEVFRQIKAALDPNGILNPHVLLPDG